MALLLLSLLGLSISAVLQKSATWDETHYLGAGRYWMKTHRFDRQDTWLHPLFWTAWHDLPLLAAPIPEAVWQERNGVSLGQKIIALRQDDFWLNACRFSLLPFALGLGLVVFAWSRKLYGETGGVLSLALFCFCPNIIAHAPLITPDMTLSCFTVMSAWRLWRLAKAPSLRNLIWAGLAMGLMALSKFTGLLFLMVLVITDVTYRLAAGEIEWRTPQGRWRGLRHWAALLVMVMLLVWGCYGFQVGAVTLPSGAVVLMPAPLYFQGLIFQFIESNGTHSFFLMGMRSQTGWWYYYVIVCLVKLPAGTLLLAAGVVLAWRRLGLRFQLAELYLVIPFLGVVLYLSFLNTIHNGFRYLLPVYPLILIFLGKYGTVFSRGLAVRVWVCALAFWTAAATLCAWPDYLAYFNEFIGGSRQGYHWLGDSNLDWGQDLKELKRYMDRHGIKSVRLAYFGTADPAHYGIDYEYLLSANSALRRTQRSEGQATARFVALGAYQYQAIDLENKDFYKFFYRYEPSCNVGGSILVYDLEALVPRVRAPLPLRIRFFGQAAPPLDACP